MDIFGLNIKKTNLKISEIKSEYESRMSKLESEIDDYKSKLISLDDEYSEINKELKKVPYSLATLEYALENIDSTLNYIDEITKKDIAQITNASKQMLEEINLNITLDYKKFMEIYKFIYEIIQSLDKILEKYSGISLLEKGEKKSNIIQYAERFKKKKQKADIFETYDIISKNEHINEKNEKADFWESLPNKMTSDGLTVQEIDSSESKQKDIMKLLNKISNNFEEETLSNINANVNNYIPEIKINSWSESKQGTLFWDDDYELEPVRKSNITEKIEEKAAYKVEDSEKTPDIIKGEKINNDKDQEKVSKQEINEEPDKLKEEIRLLQNNYIVGKISGKDIYDRNGKLIIAKNKEITSEVIDFCAKEGMLPELIINMLLPELGD
jgi:hypothetical protein